MAGKLLDTDGGDICTGSMFDVFSAPRKDDSINFVKDLYCDPIYKHETTVRVAYDGVADGLSLRDFLAVS